MLDQQLLWWVPTSLGSWQREEVPTICAGPSMVIHQPKGGWLKSCSLAWAISGPPVGMRTKQPEVTCWTCFGQKGEVRINFFPWADWWNIFLGSLERALSECSGFNPCRELASEMITRQCCPRAGDQSLVLYSLSYTNPKHTHNPKWGPLEIKGRLQSLHRNLQGWRTSCGKEMHHLSG